MSTWRSPPPGRQVPGIWGGGSSSTRRPGRTGTKTRPEAREGMEVRRVPAPRVLNPSAPATAAVPTRDDVQVRQRLTNKRGIQDTGYKGKGVRDDPRPVIAPCPSDRDRVGSLTPNGMGLWERILEQSSPPCGSHGRTVSSAHVGWHESSCVPGQPARLAVQAFAFQ